MKNKKNSLRVLRSRSGQSLIQTLVSMGITLIIIAGMASYMTSQSRETRALSEKLAALDVEKLLISSLADGQICSAELANPAIWTTGATPYTVNHTSAATLLAESKNLTSLHSGILNTSPALVQVGVPPSPMSTSLTVAGITINNFRETGVDQYLVDIVISFTGTVRPIKPIVLQKTIKTASLPIGAKAITSCLGAAATPSGTAGVVRKSNYRQIFAGMQLTSSGVASIFPVGTMVLNGTIRISADGATATVSGYGRGYNFTSPNFTCVLPAQTNTIEYTASCPRPGGGGPNITMRLMPALDGPSFSGGGGMSIQPTPALWD